MTGVRFPAVAVIFFSSLPRPDRLWSPLVLSSGYHGTHPAGVKRPGGETDHSLASNSTPPYGGGGNFTSGNTVGRCGLDSSGSG
jgi:hypothetical protein